MGACKQQFKYPPKRKKFSLEGELVGSGDLVIQNTLVANQPRRKTDDGEAMSLCLTKNKLC